MDVVAGPTKADAQRELTMVPRILDQLESSMIDIECALLDTLTPAQFALIQELVQATRILTTARCVVGEQQRRDLEHASVATACARRPRRHTRRRSRFVEMSAVAPSAARRS
jgi:hypothetical protein